jgi:hypothetical protein
MDLSAVPYLIVSRKVESLRVFVCLCPVDHMVVGVGLSRDEALKRMIAELSERHGDDWRDGEAVPEFTRN